MDTPVWKSHEAFPDGVPHFSLHIIENIPYLRIPLTGTFRFDGDGVCAFLEDNAHPAPFFLGKVLGLCLELMGFPVLHGSCLELNGKAIGLLGFSGMGKSTLSAALWSRGHAVITDDLIPVDPNPPHRVQPGIPVSRMWPDTAQHFLGDTDRLEKVHPNFAKFKVPDVLEGQSRFSKQAHPLSALFILDRRTEPMGKPLATPVRGAGALMELVRHSYHPDMVRTLELQQSRLNTLAMLLEKIPMYSLAYESGYCHLDSVYDLIIRQEFNPT